jgi:ubiquitin-activating enzyme E1
MVFARRDLIVSLFNQFFLREDDVGKPRAEATIARLAELNAYVPIRNLGGVAGQEISVELIKGFQVRYLFLSSTYTYIHYDDRQSFYVASHGRSS